MRKEELDFVHILVDKVWSVAQPIDEIRVGTQLIERKVVAEEFEEVLEFCQEAITSPINFLANFLVFNDHGFASHASWDAIIIGFSVSNYKLPVVALSILLTGFTVVVLHEGLEIEAECKELNFSWVHPARPSDAVPERRDEFE